MGDLLMTLMDADVLNPMDYCVNDDALMIVVIMTMDHVLLVMDDVLVTIDHILGIIDVVPVNGYVLVIIIYEINMTMDVVLMTMGYVLIRR